MPNNHRANFIPARDSRNRRVAGLYLRGDRYYAQLWIDVGNGKKAARKFPLRDGDNQSVRNCRSRGRKQRTPQQPLRMVQHYVERRYTAERVQQSEVDGARRCVKTEVFGTAALSCTPLVRRSGEHRH